MSDCRNFIERSVSLKIKRSETVDIYQIVAQVKQQFPDLIDEELAKMVAEEVIAAHGNALWERKGN